MSACWPLQSEISDAQAHERNAQRLVRDFFSANRDELQWIARWGDGECGEIKRIACLELLGIYPYAPREKPGYQKGVIPNKLRIEVFERDAYRCVTCGSWRSLTCDHIVPESLGGETALENLQTMCRGCNSRKGTKSGV